MKRLPPAWARLDGPSRFALCAAAALLFGISGGVLWHLGYNYDGLTGGPATKIHPSTYIILLLFGWSLIACGEPVRRTLHLINQRPAATVMLAVTFAIVAATAIRGGPGLGGLFDTYLACGFLMLLMVDADEDLMDRLETIVHVLMTANALLALAEFILQMRLFPYRLDGKAFEWDTRSTALHGHPLANAMVTACYLMALITGARGLSTGRRAAMIGLQGMALVVFGGRTASLTALALGAVFGLWRLLGQLRHGRMPLLGTATGFVMAAIVPAAIGALVALGFFDTLVSRFSSDGGSAEARRGMFELLAMFPAGDLIFGPDVELLDSMRRVQGLEWGIENPVVRMVLYQGIVVTVAILGSFLLVMRELSRITGPGLWLPMIMWFVLLNGAETIATKTTVTTKFVLIALTLFRPERQPAVRREVREVRSSRALRPHPGRSDAWHRP